MPISWFGGEPDDPAASDSSHPEVGVTSDDSPEPTSWPATRFSVDPASSPVLMAAFAWSSPRAAEVRRSG